MDTLIPIINKVQDAFTITGSSGLEAIQLPQIVVVGSQSSGKTSVLESLVGRSFLPRGSGIVTRCPVVLQLIHISESDAEYLAKKEQGIEEWCVFLHKPTVVFTDFDKVREEIESETNRIAGTNRGISTDSISIKIFSKDVLHLTVVDLPGLVKVPSGDQPEDIEDQINQLVMSYISNPNSIILAVSPANNDIATSESLKFAKHIDPSGARTLAVVTKLDLMDSGTNAVDVLTGRVLPVKLGIVGVVNRSQQDIIDNKPIVAGLKSEAAFLASHYPLLASTNGIPYLAKRLNKILMDHICTCIPALESRMRSLIQDCQNTLKSLKEDGSDLNSMLLDILIKFDKAYCAAIMGRTRFIESEKLTGGALVNFAFDETFHNDLNRVDPIKDVSDQDILTTIRNSRGVESKLFVPEDAYQDLVKKQIRRLETPSIECAHNIESAMKRVVEDCLVLPELHPYMERFPVLSANISGVVRDIISNSLETAEENIRNYISIHSSFVYTVQKEFEEKIHNLKGMDVLETMLEGKQIAGTNAGGDSSSSFELAAGNLNEKTLVLSESQLKQCEIVRELMRSYFAVVKGAVRDYIPKALIYSMVYHMVDNLQRALLTELHIPDKLEKLMVESDTISVQRSSASSMLKALENATEIITEVRNTNF